VYGFKRDSILNQSKFFHVIDGLDLDPMHDQLEGVLPLELKMLLFRYIQSDKMVTLTTINERIASFDHGLADATNKPSPLKDQVFSSNSASISQTGILCLYTVHMFIRGCPRRYRMHGKICHMHAKILHSCMT
jgi:hypothetical protein